MFFKLVLAIIIIFLISLVIYKLSQKENFSAETPEIPPYQGRCNRHVNHSQLHNLKIKDHEDDLSNPGFQKRCTHLTDKDLYYNSPIYLGNSESNSNQNTSIGNTGDDDMSMDIPAYDINYCEGIDINQDGVPTAKNCQPLTEKIKNITTHLNTKITANKNELETQGQLLDGLKDKDDTHEADLTSMDNEIDDITNNTSGNLAYSLPSLNTQLSEINTKQVALEGNISQTTDLYTNLLNTPTIALTNCSRCLANKPIRNKNVFTDDGRKIQMKFGNCRSFCILQKNQQAGRCKTPLGATNPNNCCECMGSNNRFITIKVINNDRYLKGNVNRLNFINNINSVGTSWIVKKLNQQTVTTTVCCRDLWENGQPAYLTCTTRSTMNSSSSASSTPTYNNVHIISLESKINNSGNKTEETIGNTTIIKNQNWIITKATQASTAQSAQSTQSTQSAQSAQSAQSTPDTSDNNSSPPETITFSPSHISTQNINSNFTSINSSDNLFEFQKVMAGN